MKKPQLITIGIALLMVAGVYFFVRITPKKKKILVTEQHGPGDGHNHEEAGINIDSILILAKKQLSPDQLARVSKLEGSIKTVAQKEEQIHVYHQLARYWSDTVRFFEPYAWYLAEAARLENSEKSLTFAAQLFLENLQMEQVLQRRKWKALQAKDLFERSLKINPLSDSAKVGLGAAYLFGDISATPMEGILKIREVAEKDSNNVYAQLMLGKASMISGQYDKAVARLETVCRLQPENLDAVLLLAEVYERTGDKKKAVIWYQKSLRLVRQKEMQEAIRQRIGELSK